MGNGLFSNYGVDIAGLLNKHLSPGLLPVTLFIAGAAGERSEGELSKGPAAGADTAYVGRGLLEDFDPIEFQTSQLLEAGDRKLLIIAESFKPELPEDPGSADVAQIEGVKYRVARTLSRDPAAATYVLQVRDM